MDIFGNNFQILNPSGTINRDFGIINGMINQDVGMIKNIKIAI